MFIVLSKMLPEYQCLPASPNSKVFNYKTAGAGMINLTCVGLFTWADPAQGYSPNLRMLVARTPAELLRGSCVAAGSLDPTPAPDGRSAISDCTQFVKLFARVSLEGSQSVEVVRWRSHIYGDHFSNFSRQLFWSPALS